MGARRWGWGGSRGFCAGRDRNNRLYRYAQQSADPPHPHLLAPTHPQLLAKNLLRSSTPRASGCQGYGFASLVGLGLLAGAEVERGDAVLGELGHVGPRLLGLGRRSGDANDAIDDRMVAARVRGGGEIDDRDLAAGGERANVGFDLLGIGGGAEARVDVDLEAIGDDVARATAEREGGGEDLAEEEAVEGHVAHGTAASAARNFPPLWIAFSPARGALLGGAAGECHFCVEGADAAELDLVVGGLPTYREVELYELGDRVEEGAQPVFGERPLLAIVVDPGEIEGEASRSSESNTNKSQAIAPSCRSRRGRTGDPQRSAEDWDRRGRGRRCRGGRRTRRARRPRGGAKPTIALPWRRTSARRARRRAST